MAIVDQFLHFSFESVTFKNENTRPSFLALPPSEPMQNKTQRGNESVSITANNKIVILELSLSCSLS